MSLSLFETDNTLGNVSAASYGPGLGGSASLPGGVGGSVNIPGSGGTVNVPSGIGGSVGSGSGGGASAGLGGGAFVGLRDVVVRVRGDVVGVGGVIFLPLGAYRIVNARDAIRDALWQRNWAVKSVSQSPGSFDVAVSVKQEYSDSQIINNMRRDLADVVTVTGVSVVSKSAVTYVTPSGFGSVNIGSAGADDTGFLSNLGLGLGVSTPVVLLGGAVLLVLLMRR